MTYLTLLELNQIVQGCLQPLLAPVWVIAEIAEIKPASSGHVYLELVEKDNNSMVAKLQAVIWANSFFAIQNKFGNDTNLLLKKGNKVLFKGIIDFHTVFGLKFVIQQIDASVTLGELEAKRLATLNQLISENQIGLNQKLPLPLVLQNIAIISSANAAGYDDFINQVNNNLYGYKIKYTLFAATMQGDGAPIEITTQLNKIAIMGNNFDAVVIIRGGGSKLDLACFNDYNLCVAVANCPIPVFTGIGHQQDENLIDLVSYRALKTPTAVAEFIIQSFLHFEGVLNYCWKNVSTHYLKTISQCKNELYYLEQAFKKAVKGLTIHEKEKIGYLQLKIKQDIKHFLQIQNSELQYLERLFLLYNVNNLLQRGFSITRINGKVVTDPKLLLNDAVIETEVAYGTFLSKVTRTTP